MSDQGMTPAQAVKFLEFVLAAYKHDRRLWINGRGYMLDEPSQVTGLPPPTAAMVTLRHEPGIPLAMLFVNIGKVQTAFAMSPDA